MSPITSHLGYILLKMLSSHTKQKVTLPISPTGVIITNYPSLHSNGMTTCYLNLPLRLIRMRPKIHFKSILPNAGRPYIRKITTLIMTMMQFQTDFP